MLLITLLIAQVRRIMAEWKEIVAAGLHMQPSVRGTLVGNGTELVRMFPHPNTLFEWHFTFAGAPGSDYEGGLYHGTLLLPYNYPQSPPSVRVWTPSGR